MVESIRQSEDGMRVVDARIERLKVRAARLGVWRGVSRTDGRAARVRTRRSRSWRSRSDTRRSRACWTATGKACSSSRRSR